MEAELVGFMAANLDECENPYKDLHSQFRNKNTWKPPNIHLSLDVFQRAFMLGLLKAKPKTLRHKNLTNQETLGLSALRDNPNIVIKKADKGSAIVVINTKDYLREGYRQLSDNDFYTKLQNDPTLEIKRKIDETLGQMRAKGLITEENLTISVLMIVVREDFTYFQKYTKRVYQGDLFVALLITPLVKLVNLLMNISKSMLQKPSLTSATPRTSSGNSKH